MVLQQIVHGVAATGDVDAHRTAQRVVADGSRHRAAGGLVHFIDPPGAALSLPKVATK